MGNKTFIAVIAAIVIGFVALIVTSDSTDAPRVDQSREEILTVQEIDYVKNDVSTDNIEDKAVIIEYADFQCPACAAIYPIVQQSLAQYDDEVVFVFRHFPLVSIHPNAMIAHRAAAAAGEQDQFYPMHDILFEQQQIWSNADDAQSIIDGYAEQIGLDMDQYRATFNSGETLSFINSQLDAGESLGVTGTPTFFIDGEQVQTPRTVEEFTASIDAALAN